MENPYLVRVNYIPSESDHEAVQSDLLASGTVGPDEREQIWQIRKRLLGAIEAARSRAFALRIPDVPVMIGIITILGLLIPNSFRLKPSFEVQDLDYRRILMALGLGCFLTLSVWYIRLRKAATIEMSIDYAREILTNLDSELGVNEYRYIP